jgi:predicted RNA binding protein YcfA (HicA-like mRNA interferase family)
MMSGYLDGVKVRDIIKRLEADGWRQISQEGSHRQFKHSTKKGRVTVAGKPGDEPPPATVKSIFKQAQIEER